MERNKNPMEVIEIDTNKYYITPFFIANDDNHRHILILRTYLTKNLRNY